MGEGYQEAEKVPAECMAGSFWFSISGCAWESMPGRIERAVAPSCMSLLLLH